MHQKGEDKTSEDFDQISKYLYKALQGGYFEAKEYLDDIYDLTSEFKHYYPDFKKWDGDYTDFCN